MAKIYARRIIAGAILFSDVPDRWRAETQTILIEEGYEVLCDE